MRDRSLSNVRWFCTKKSQNWEGKSVINLKLNLVETKFAVQKIITIRWVTCAQKNSQIRTSIKQLLARYRFFKKLPQISHIHKKLLSKKNWKFKTNCFYPINFMAEAWENTLFQFCQLWLVKGTSVVSYRLFRFTMFTATLY